MASEMLCSRLTLVEDHALFAQALGLVLGSRGCQVDRARLPDEQATTSQLVRIIVLTRPDTVLLDLDLGRHGSGVRLVEPLSRAGIAVVVLTADLDQARWGECVASGARKVLAKSRPLADVLAIVHRLEQGLPVMTQDEREHLLELWQDRLVVVRERRERLARLTRREAQVLAHLVEGHQVRDIARVGVVSEATVRTQVKSILAKLQVSSQLGAVGLARHAGWTPDENPPR